MKKITKIGRSFVPIPADTDNPPNRIALEAAERLRQASELAGGPSAMAARSGIPLRSLNNYLRGTEMRRDVLVAAADAQKRCVDATACRLDEECPPFVPPPGCPKF